VAVSLTYGSRFREVDAMKMQPWREVQGDVKCRNLLFGIGLAILLVAAEGGAEGEGSLWGGLGGKGSRRT